MEMSWFEISDIILNVIQITKDNLVKWNAFSDNGINTFFIDLGSGRLSIWRQYESMDDEYDYAISIDNGVGETIYSYSTEFQNRENQHILQELYYVAENSHLQRQATISSMRDAIERLKSGNIF